MLKSVWLVMPMTKKSTKCTTLLAFLFLLSAGVNSIFIVTAGGCATELRDLVVTYIP